MYLSYYYPNNPATPGEREVTEAITFERFIILFKLKCLWFLQPFRQAPIICYLFVLRLQVIQLVYSKQLLIGKLCPELMCV